MSNNTPDFGGYVTRNNVKCSDGRIILKDAFAHNDGQQVPLVWQHMTQDINKVLGHVILENREDGVYGYGFLNHSQQAAHAKLLIGSGDITALSIYANGLKEEQKRVRHGQIREVSLVVSGANPGAHIDYVNIVHSDGDEEQLDDVAIIHGFDPEFSLSEDEEDEEYEEETEEVVEHADNTDTASDEKPADKEDSMEEETVGDVFLTFNEKQKELLFYLVGSARNNKALPGEIQQSAYSENEGVNFMKHNVFDQAEQKKSALSHSQMEAIFTEARKVGSLKQAVVNWMDDNKEELAHAGTYGIDNIDYLFPDARPLTDEPTWVTRRMEWVGVVLGGTRKSPFSRIKSLHADITADEARAKGYVLAAQKVEEVFPILRRTTTPTTVYKKQKLDRDDIVDITDFDVVYWLKQEMRIMLDEEIARAILVGDGRSGASADKISETNIRPIWTDDAVYVHHEQVALAGHDWDVLIDDMLKARVNYRGTGMPDLFVSPSVLNNWLLLRDLDGRRLYRNMEELASELRVKNIVEVPIMEGLQRTDTVLYDLIAIMVNMRDYTVGADKGGQVSMFDDFDIDYNQYKYLIEGRMSGALWVPKAAIVLERANA